MDSFLQYTVIFNVFNFFLLLKLHSKTFYTIISLPSFTVYVYFYFENLELILYLQDPPFFASCSSGLIMVNGIAETGSPFLDQP
jgi:hypothetical protein